MADETEKTEKPEKPKKEDQGKKPAVPAKGNKKILLIAIAAVVVVGLGAGAFFFLKGRSANHAQAEPAKAAEEGSHDSPEAAKKSDSHGSPEAAKKSDSHGSPEAAKNSGQANLLALDPFIVNLQDNSGTRYLKLTLSLELEGGGEEITALTAKIRDSLIVLLSSKSYADIGTVEGKYQMRDEIVARVNQFLTKTKVKSVYFSDLVIQ